MEIRQAKIIIYFDYRLWTNQVTTLQHRISCADTTPTTNNNHQARDALFIENERASLLAGWLLIPFIKDCHTRSHP
jgi:hypothetical protein